MGNTKYDETDQVTSWTEVILVYNAALKEVGTKLEILSDEFQHVHRYNPIEHIKSRIKTSESIVKKLKRYGYESTIQNMVKYVNDIAGIRVICSFPEDIYTIAELLSKQDDISVLRRKDYIKHPKENGYRSLHLILEIPIFLSEEKKYMKVEVQFRTIAMDFWASVEHKLKYKKNIKEPEKIAEQLKHCAETIADVDFRMQAIRHEIDRDAEQEEDDEV